MRSVLTLGLCGDMTLGRGVDQAFDTSCDPRLYERSVRNAKRYLRMAERENGPVPTPISCSYLWGEALPVINKVEPDLLAGNLETSVTTHSSPWKGKGIHYRMHPDNTECLKRLGVDCAVLANNHVLDWSQAGLEETLTVLEASDIAVAGAGRAEQAEQPAVFQAGDTRVLVYGFGSTDSGIPPAWQADDDQAGVNLLHDFRKETVDQVIEQIRKTSGTDDIVVCSIHWGGNWGWGVPDLHVRTAYRLIGEANVDLIHGHSSHHPKPLEVYDGSLVLYGCGDFINDYEGISGHEEYRGDLSVLYLPELDRETGTLERLRMAVFQVHQLRLRSASAEDTRWLRDTLNQYGERFGTVLTQRGENELVLEREGTGPADNG